MGMGGGAAGRAGPSPTMQQRIKAIGVPTPLAMSSPVRRSNPGTPTQPRRPDFIGVGAPAAYYDFAHGPSAAAAAAAGAAAAAAAQARGQAYGSPQRRFLSEGELVRGPAPPPDHLAYARTNNTVDNIRELAGSPQRGVYMWKDTSPSAYAAPGAGAGLPGPATAAQGSYAPHPHSHTQPAPPRPHYDYYRSTPTSPTQQGFARPHHPYGYPPVRGGVAVFPPQSPQLKRKANTPTTPTAAVGLALGDDGGPRRHSPGSRRPMSFVRALEMSDSMELCGGGGGVGGVGERADPRHDGRAEQHRLALDGRLARSATPTPDRASVYDMNYEISV